MLRVQQKSDEAENWKDFSQGPRGAAVKKDIITYNLFAELVRQICTSHFFKPDAIFSFLSVHLGPKRETKHDLAGWTANLQNHMALAVF